MTPVRVLAALAVFALLGLAVGGGASARPQVNFDVAVTVSVSEGRPTRACGRPPRATHQPPLSSYSWSPFEFKAFPTPRFDVQAGRPRADDQQQPPNSRRPTADVPVHADHANGSLGERWSRGQLAYGSRLQATTLAPLVSIVFAGTLHLPTRPHRVLHPLPDDHSGRRVTPHSDYTTLPYQYEAGECSWHERPVPPECRAGQCGGRTVLDAVPAAPCAPSPPVQSRPRDTRRARPVQDTVRRSGRRRGYQCYASAPERRDRRGGHVPRDRARRTRSRPPPATRPCSCQRRTVVAPPRRPGARQGAVDLVEAARFAALPTRRLLTRAQRRGPPTTCRAHALPRFVAR